MGSKVKTFKIILILLSALLIFSGSIALLLFTPWIQKTVALAVLEDKIEGSVELKSVYLLPGSLSLEGLKYLDQGVEVAAEKVRIEFSLSQLLMEKEIKLSKINVTGLIVDVSRVLEESPPVYDAQPILQTRRPGPGPAPSDIIIKQRKETFAGLLHTTDIGYGIWVESLSIDGKIVLPVSREIEFFLEGRDVRPSASSTLSLTGSLNDQNPDAPISSMDFDGELMLEQKADSGFSKVRIVSTVYDRGAAFEGVIALRSDSDIEITNADGESHRLRVVLIDAQGGENVLIDLTDEYDFGESEFRGSFQLNMVSEQLKPFTMGLPLPSITAVGSGTFDYSLTDRTGSLSTIIEGQVDELEALRPELKGIPPLGFQTEIDIKKEGNSFWINKLTGTVNNKENGKKMVSLASNSAFRIDPNDDSFGLDQARGRLLLFTFDAIPAEWVNPFFMDTDNLISGGSMSGDFALLKEGANFKILMTKPFLISEISFSKGGREILKNIDVVMRGDIGVNLAMKENSFNIETVELLSDGVQLLEGNLNVKLNPGGKKSERLLVEGNISARMKEWHNQPFAEKFSLPAGVASLNLEQGFTMTLEKDLIRVENLVGHLKDDAGQEIISGSLLKPVSFQLPTNDLSLNTLYESDVLFNLTFSKFPMNLIDSYISGYELTSGHFSGQIMVASSDGTIEFKSEKTLSFKQIHLSERGRPVLENFSLDLISNFSLGQKNLNISWSGLEAFTGNDSSIKSNGEVSLDWNQEFPLRKASGNIQVNITNLARQPFFSRISIADSGSATLDGDFNLNNQNNFSGQVLITDLKSSSIPEHPTIRVEVSAEGRLENGFIEIKAPMSLQGVGGNSDAILTTQLERQEMGTKFSISAQGNSLVLADAFALAALFDTNIKEVPQPIKKTTRTARLPAPSNLLRESKPFWSGYSGEARIDFGEVAYPGIGQLDDVEAVLNATENRLFFETINSGSTKQPLGVTGKIDFMPGHKKPYSLEARVELSKFDAGQFIRKSDPLHDPIVEGIFDLKGTLTGEAENLPRLLETAQGDFFLESTSGGVFRALPLTGQKSQVASFALTGLDILLGNKVREINTANRAAILLQEIKFEEMKVVAVRGPDLNLNLTNLFVRGLEIILAGTGRVTYKEAVPFLEQPLIMNAQMGAKDEAAYLLNELGLLENTQTDDGYYVGPSFSIRGTLGNPDKSELHRLLRSLTFGFLGAGGRKVNLEKQNQTEDAAETEKPPGGKNLQPKEESTKEEAILRSIFKIISDGQE